MIDILTTGIVKIEIRNILTDIEVIETDKNKNKGIEIEIGIEKKKETGTNKKIEMLIDKGKEITIKIKIKIENITISIIETNINIEDLVQDPGTVMIIGQDFNDINISRKLLNRIKTVIKVAISD